MKKPYKSGGCFVTDGDGKILKFTKSEVMKRFKRMCKNGGWTGLTRYYVYDAGDYWTASAC